MFKPLFATLLVLLLALPVIAQPTTPGDEAAQTARYHSARSLLASPDGKLLAAVFNVMQREAQGTRSVPVGMKVQVWDVATGERKWSLEREGKAIASVQFSPNSSRLLFNWLKFGPGKNPVEGLQYTAQLYDAATGSSVVPLEMQAGEFITAFLFTPDGKHIVNTMPQARPAADEEFSLGIGMWDAVSGKRLALIEDLEPQIIMGFSRDGQKIFGMSYKMEGNKLLDSKLAVRSWPALQAISTVVPGKALAAKSAFSPDGKLVAMVSYPTDDILTAKEFEIGIWSLESGQIENILTPEAVNFSVTELAFSPDSRSLIASGIVRRDDAPTGMELWLWNVESGALERTVNKEKTFGQNMAAGELLTCLIPERKSFFITGEGGKVELRGLEEGALVRSFE